METDIMASYHNGETFADENYSNFSIVNKKKRARQRAAAELAAEAAAVAAAAQARYNSNPNSFNDIEGGGIAAAAAIAAAQEQRRKDAVNAMLANAQTASVNNTAEVTDLAQQEKNRMEAAAQAAKIDAIVVKDAAPIEQKEYKLNTPTINKDVVANADTIQGDSASSKVAIKETLVPKPTLTKPKWLTPTVIGGGVLLIAAIAYLKMRNKTV